MPDQSRPRRTSSCLHRSRISSSSRDIETFDGFFNDLLTTPIQWEDGSVTVPDVPGLGFELNEDVADANPYTAEAVFPPMAEVPL